MTVVFQKLQSAVVQIREYFQRVRLLGQRNPDFCTVYAVTDSETDISRSSEILTGMLEGDMNLWDARMSCLFVVVNYQNQNFPAIVLN